MICHTDQREHSHTYQFIVKQKIIEQTCKYDISLEQLQNGKKLYMILYWMLNSESLNTLSEQLSSLIFQQYQPLGNQHSGHIPAAVSTFLLKEQD